MEPSICLKTADIPAKKNMLDILDGIYLYERLWKNSGVEFLSKKKQVKDLLLLGYDVPTQIIWDDMAWSHSNCLAGTDFLGFLGHLLTQPSWTLKKKFELYFPY